MTTRWKIGDWHTCPLGESHHATEDCAAYAIGHGDRTYAEVTGLVGRLVTAARDARYAFVDSWRGELLDADPPAPPPAPAPDPVDAAVVMYRQMVEAADEFWTTVFGQRR